MSRVLLLGASVRAMAMSAHRAGWQAWAIDLFGDRDLSRLGSTQRCAAELYPSGLVAQATKLPMMPWLYTGALENAPDVLDQIGQVRPLWGNEAARVRSLRDPWFLAESLRRANLPALDVYRGAHELPSGRFLRKPRASAAGIGIMPAHSNCGGTSQADYYQRQVTGRPGSSIFIANGSRAYYYGSTWLLTGSAWLHTPRPFQYAGNIGPIRLPREAWTIVSRAAQVLTQQGHLRGLFGLDWVMANGCAWITEINPRYPASVEVLELSQGIPYLAAHAQGCRGEPLAEVEVPESMGVIGKAILYAQRPLVFPKQGPWEWPLATAFSTWEIPPYADIPHPGQAIAAGAPIFTLLERAAEPIACEQQLKRRVREVQAWLEGDSANAANTVE